MYLQVTTMMNSEALVFCCILPDAKNMGCAIDWCSIKTPPTIGLLADNFIARFRSVFCPEFEGLLNSELTTGMFKLIEIGEIHALGDKHFAIHFRR